MMDTKATTIFLNSTGHRGKATTELQGFFDLMNGQSKGHDRFNRRLIHDMKRIKADPAKEREFMDLAMKLYDERQEGKKEGIREAAINMITELRKDQLSDEEIQHNVYRFFGKDLSAKEINKLIKRN